LEVDNNRNTTNSIFQGLTPQLGTYYRFTVQQQLLAGFGTGPNLRYLRIAKNNKKISDIAFKTQVIATMTRSPTSTGTWSAPTRKKRSMSNRSPSPSRTSKTPRNSCSWRPSPRWT